MTFKVKDGLQVGSTLAIDANGKLTTSLSTPRTITLSGDVSGSASFDGSANITITTTNTANSIALGTDTTGNYMVNVAAGGGISVSHTQGEGSTATVSHSDTSSVSNLSSDNSSGTVIQDVALTFDTYGHVTGASVGTVNLDGRYYTEGESDVAFGKSHSGSDFVDGTLVTTNIPATAASGASFVLEATGKSYSSSPPHDFKVQGYLYNSTIINTSGVSNGAVQSYVKVMEYGGYLCFWWPRWGYWNSYQVHVRDAGGSRENRVTSITNSALPAGNKIVQINLNQSALYGYSGGASGSLYAASYYDGNDTAYYVDPASTSRMNIVHANTFLGEITDSGNGDANAPFRFESDYSGWVSLLANTPGAGNGWGTFWAGNDNPAYTYFGSTNPNEYVFVGAGAVKASIDLDNGQSYFGTSVRSPIFYDSDNTGYYVDPNSTSNLNTATIGTARITTLYATDFGLEDSGLDCYIHIGDDNPTWNGTAYGGIFQFYGDKAIASSLLYAGGLSLTSHLQADSSVRSPIFYDQNDTGYYVDPNSTGTSYRGRGEIFLGPNTSSQYLRLGGNGGATDHPTVSTSNGNLHIDAKSDNNLYLAWYNSSDVMVGGGMQATIYYDRNNTGYYCDPASTSNFNQVNAKGKSLLEVGGIGSATTGTWYTIAVNSGNRASARFSLTDYTSSCHQSVDFYATHHYGNYSGINVISQGYYSTTPFRYLRIVEGGTYDGAMLQVYMDTTSSGPNSWMMDNFQSSGWVLLGTWIPHGTNPGTVANFAALTNVAAQVDLDTTGVGGMVMTGNIYAGGNVTAYSDRRLKTNITKIDNALEKLSKINGYTFDRVDRHMERQAGVIAQEVVEVLPEVVGGEGTDDSPYAVSYGNMSALLIEAIKEQQTQIDELKSMVQALLNK